MAFDMQVVEDYYGTSSKQVIGGRHPVDGETLLKGSTIRIIKGQPDDYGDTYWNPLMDVLDGAEFVIIRDIPCTDDVYRIHLITHSPELAVKLDVFRKWCFVPQWLLIIN
jgi:hypothetical protein